MRPVRGVTIQMIAANRTAEKSLFVRWVVVVVPETVKKENGFCVREVVLLVEIANMENGCWLKEFELAKSWPIKLGRI
ncbi:hypothetical protein MA16_Dca001617 [Dendrobium catenatum]|uniref:Uncharacterized protein n=1 Tax=Dendrobium catenatum TaxID=906689 RepID=A0A2I0WMY8_9ASPA|nr:hypothetical protein MA16_Dca001617 [Dendrobium catenatum]